MAAALVTAVTLAACDDVPLLPQWSADIYVPLGASNVGNIPSGTVIPSNSFANVPGAVRSVPLDGTAADILTEALDEAAPIIRLEVRVTKTANLSLALSDTVFLAGSAAGLATATVYEFITMGSAATLQVDTLQLDAAGINLIRQLVFTGDSLFLQARGRVTSGPAPVTVQNTDSINVKIGVLVRVPIARGN